MAFLALDIGNTRLKWALYTSLEEAQVPLCHGVEFLDNIDTLSEKDWAHLPIQPTQILCCNVAGISAQHRVKEQLSECFDIEPTWLVPSLCEAGVTNGYENPSRLGIDRWIAMIGAWHHVHHQKDTERHPIIVVMIGTAVTVEAIDHHGVFLGGLILPGHGIMLRALESGTAGLRVPTGDVKDFPKNTSDALTSGGTFAISGAVKRMVKHLRTYSRREPKIIMTGGAGWKMLPFMDMPCELVESLIFDGLLVIARSRQLCL